MKANYKFFIAVLFTATFFPAFSQTEEIKLDPIKVKMYTPYIEFKHSFGNQTFEQWKSVNKLQYAKEMWYYSESFYVKRNVSTEGVSMDESQIDISRFEQHRKQSEEFTLILPGFKDAIVFLPIDKLIYKPN